MKKALIALAAIIFLIIFALIILPVFFKDDIKAAIDKEVDNSIDANVIYDTQNINLSFFKNFPNLSLSIDQFGIVGKDSFDGDTLAWVESFDLSIDLLSLVSGDQIKINAISINQTDILVKVLESGAANYDIAKESDSATDSERASQATTFNLKIQRWEINNASISYIDESQNLNAYLTGLTHSGNGDFSQDLFDIESLTSIESVTLAFDGIKYIDDRILTIDMGLNMNLPNQTYTFLENRVALNDFGFMFDGDIKLDEEDIITDISFIGQDIDLKSLLSLIPQVYQQDLKAVKTKGDVSFKGSVSGIYNEASMPAIKLYLGMQDGYLAHPDNPLPLENIALDARLDYPSNDLKDTNIDVENFSFTIEEEKTIASLKLHNLENYHWDFKIDGKLDLEKITNVIHLDDSMDLRGLVDANLSSKGSYSDLEAARYQKIESQGRIDINDFYFVSKDFFQGLEISEAIASFSPTSIALTKFKSKAGNSDFELEGSLSNYLGYLMNGEKITGRLNHQSDLISLNDWMTEATPEEETDSDTSGYGTIKVPTNIDFRLTSNINSIIYDNLELNNAKGGIIIKDGAVNLSGLSFNLLDGDFLMKGSYKTANVNKPAYDFNFNIKDLSINKAFENISLINNLVPIANVMTGKFSTNFSLNGLLNENMDPVYETMNGSGLVNVIESSVSNPKIISSLSNFSSLSDLNKTIEISNLGIKAEIKNGRLYIDPFDVQLGNYSSTISGSNGIDGSLDYMIKMLVPGKYIKNSLGNKITKFTNFQSGASSNIILPFKITGTYNEPKISLAFGSESGKDLAKSLVQQKVDEKKEEAKDHAEETIQEGKAELKEKKEEVAEELKETAEEQKKEAEDKIKDKLKDLFGKKKKEKKKENEDN